MLGTFKQQEATGVEDDDYYINLLQAMVRTLAFILMLTVESSYPVSWAGM